eukprot:CAMPEP_0113469064 /NCGR_PEP_ID=MMETSP0014_2-20120614/15697_1 /TAXON_ID=2857 /ORGANISM="Nitzschia sp." /LENGTH=431 /DNA_ID=CAMNT_0000361511 /DNA_START=312 /DNA_END=1607 /DNA_ORIENTATION=- /assembly_acc=CAM_ASM_000159
MASYPSSVTDASGPSTPSSPFDPQPSSSMMIPSTPTTPTVPSPTTVLPSLPVTTTATAAVASLATNVQAVGAMWMISSAFFTTYSTTKFLKYKKAPPQASTTTKKRQTFIPAAAAAAASGMLPSQSRSTKTASTTKKIFHRPHLSLSRSTLLTLYRFSGSLLIGILIGTTGDLRIASIVARIRHTYELCPSFVLPALFLFIANYANTISLDKMGISLTYVTKCAIPLFTVLLTAILDGLSALPSLKVLLTLVPIAGGIATASWNHPHFELAGMIAALTSCLSQAALNVSSKKTMAKLGVSGPIAQRCMVAVGLLIAIIYSSLQFMMTSSKMTTSEGNDSIDIAQQQQQSQVHPPVWLALAAVLAYHIEYMLSFIFVTLVAPVTYSACDAVRRLSIIVTGHYMFGGPPFTVLNKLGIACALLGALGYSLFNH